MNREILLTLKQAIIAEITELQIQQFFEKYKDRDLELNKTVTVERKILKCGSLRMELAGDKKGMWFRFSKNKGGDLFKLAEYLGASKKVDNEFLQEMENIMAALRFMNEPQPKQERKFPKALKKEDWKPMEIVPSGITLDIEKDFGWFLKDKRCDAIYPYRHVGGKLMGYTARFVNKDGSKDVLPISYCQNNGYRQWRLKGFVKNNVIYGAELIKLTDNILIVEGEKTCNAARKLIKQFGFDMVAISWKGGSNNAAKVDWSVLTGKNVVIWPDNDEAGIMAARDISSNAKYKSLNIIDTQALDLLEKWDLADEVPDHVNVKMKIEKYL